jgi:hypothetical protein
LNFESAFSSLAALSCLEGLMVKLITGYGTNILWHLAGKELSD